MSANPKKNTKLTIGRLADAAGVSIATVRYYQRRGLVSQPTRPLSGGFREYGEEDLARLLLIRRAQELGFTLAEVLELVAYVQDQNCDALLALADRKLDEVKRQAATLEKIHDSLSELIASCPHGCPDACPFILKLCAGEAGKP